MVRLRRVTKHSNLEVVLQITHLKDSTRNLHLLWERQRTRKIWADKLTRYFITKIPQMEHLLSFSILNKLLAFNLKSEVVHQVDKVSQVPIQLFRFLEVLNSKQLSRDLTLPFHRD